VSLSHDVQCRFHGEIRRGKGQITGIVSHTDRKKKDRRERNKKGCNFFFHALGGVQLRFKGGGGESEVQIVDSCQPEARAEDQIEGKRISYTVVVKK